MKKLLLMRLLIISLLVLPGFMSFGQSNEPLPLQVFYTSDTARPLIFYISGDGGMNKFSTGFAQAFRSKGFTVVALDARSYFWHKKDPQLAAIDINAALNQYLSKWQHRRCIIIGYSFGADVLPFIYNRLSKEVQQKVSELILLSPSVTTDFEVHVSNMLGFNSSSGQNVPAEINKLNKPILFVFGQNENDFPINKIVLRNKQVLILPGGHHYDKDTVDLCNQLLQRIH